ncbi:MULTISPECIES: DUF6766 family protein [unclassified Rathayibacter]|uniref:DUF6766 family protein n=1 Tax=unclassified Rathayibacter TaxID=2609250 RepID=UPI00188B8C30|nr:MULTISPECIES: DUF6766 family protein [unclassified Rathayibacter]MBF4461962.1 hypothetical protein [Rathayibacter sp. VKM Ac-2879]MBF4503995.1 hypothetical protein [Rathayibacter sp. VKM Ac-2878]
MSAVVRLLGPIRQHAPGRTFLRDNSLTLVFGALFLLSLVGQSIAGFFVYLQDLRTAGLDPVPYLRYLTSSSFAADVAENWQSEYLQFFLYIGATVWFVQRGSSESKTLEQRGRASDEEQRMGPWAEESSPRSAKLPGGPRRWFYSHSLLIVMGVIFAGSWFAQSIAGHIAYDEQQLMDLSVPVSWAEYLASSDFWNRTLQNWQSEFLAVGSMAALSIYLRERGSPESKAVGAPHAETGGDE